MNALNILLMGAPGSGKGTQAKLLEEQHGLPQISTGDILRDAKRRGTELGLKAKAYMDEGKLVPDQLIVDLIQDVLSSGTHERGWVLDGFPRTIPQAEALTLTLKEMGTDISHVVAIEVPENILLERICGRRSCKNCGKVYHVKFSPSPKSGACGECGGELFQRADDTEDKVRVRLEMYHAQTAQVVPYYDTEGRVVRIDGTQAPDKVFQNLVSALGLS